MNIPHYTYATERKPMQSSQVLAMSLALQRRIAESTRQVQPAIFGATPSQAAQIQRSAVLTFDHWRTIRAAMLRESALVAIWFVDRIDLYHRANESWPRPSGLGMWYPSLVVFDTKTADASAWLLAPWFAIFPGVWAEMSDSRHVLFVPKRSQDADV